MRDNLNPVAPALTHGCPKPWVVAEVRVVSDTNLEAPLLFFDHVEYQRVKHLDRRPVRIDFAGLHALNGIGPPQEFDMDSSETVVIGQRAIMM
ncbi:hypothetical protein PQR42_28125 [Paraburkholderia sediminicola]